jgi:hypothetical protein
MMAAKKGLKTAQYKRGNWAGFTKPAARTGEAGIPEGRRDERTLGRNTGFIIMFLWGMEG